MSVRAVRGGVGEGKAVAISMAISVAVSATVSTIAITVEVGVAIACIGKGSVGSTVEESRWDGRCAPACNSSSDTTSARAFHAGWASATSLSHGSSSIANVGAVGTGDEAVAQGVTDDIVIAVLVGCEYYELEGRAC